MSEKDLARAVLAQLEDWGFDCYQEVMEYQGGPRADIVATREGSVSVIEVKATLGFDVLAQAAEWQPRAHWCWVAVPAPKRGAARGRLLARKVCVQLGIGLLEVERGIGGKLEICRQELGRRNDAADPARLLAVLRPEHKTAAPAGGNGGGFWSPWRASVKALTEEAARNPGQLLREALSRISHHWRSANGAVSCVSAQIESGIITGLRLERRGNSLLLFPARP